MLKPRACLNCGFNIFRVGPLDDKGEFWGVYVEDADIEKKMRHFDSSKGEEYYSCPQCKKKNWISVEDRSIEGKGLRAKIYKVSD
jgi:hypothetical protein